MKQGKSGLLIALLFALLAALLAPSIGFADTFRAYEYFEGLPDHYTPELPNAGPRSGQGYNFRETTFDSTKSSNTLGTGDVLYDDIRYTCTGWKDAVGITPETGTANSVSFSVSNDVSITWVYQASHTLTIKAVAPSNSPSNIKGLYGWGDNTWGQLGDATRVNSAGLTKASPAYSDWSVVSMGSWHAAGIRADGSLFTWGFNTHGQLGNVSVGYASSPTQIAADSKFATVATGDSFTLALKQDGTLWGMGYNANGQLGDGTTAERVKLTNVNTAQTWKSVSAAASCALAISTDNSLWGWGDNSSLAIGSAASGSSIPVQISTAQWSSVVAGPNHSAGIKTDGTLWLWGSNRYGQLGAPPVGATTIGSTSTPTQVSGGGQWQSVSVGPYHTLAVKTDGTLWSWGYNHNGQLAYPLDTNIYAPLQVGSDNNWRRVTAWRTLSLGIKKDGTLWGWGTGSFGRGASRYYGNPTLISPYAGWSQAVVGSLSTNEQVLLVGDTTASATIHNTLWGGGRNHVGQLGNGINPVDVIDPSHDTYSLDFLANGSPNDFTVVKVGTWAHTAAIKADGSLWTWGWNAKGQLGDGSGTDQNIPKNIAPGKQFIDTDAGSEHTLAVRNDGSLWSWGLNDNGQLGDGSATAGRNTPLQVGSGFDWRFVSAGFDFSLGIKRDGSLFSWGANNNGRLGIGSTVNATTPQQVGSDKWSLAVAGYDRAAGIKQDGSLWLWGANEWSQQGDGTTNEAHKPQQIMLGSAWKAVALGYGHTLAVREDGTLWGWGSNEDYRLGTGEAPSASRVTPKQIGFGKNWRSVAAGDKASLAIKTDGTLWAWGAGPFGATGAAEQTSFATPTQIGTGTDWLQVSVGTFNSMSKVYHYEAERVLAIRSSSALEVTPHLGSRNLPAGGSYTISAKAIPTDGSTPYFLSAYTGGTGNFAASGNAFQVPVTLTQDSSMTWTNEAPSGSAQVGVGFIDGVPAEVQKSTGFFPSVGFSSLAAGSVTLSAPSEVKLAGGAVWECFGWTGTGSVPPTGATNSVTFSLSQASSIVWKYKLRGEASVTFSFGVVAGNAVTNSDAAFGLNQQSNTAGVWSAINFDPKTQQKVFEQNTVIKLTAKASVVKNGSTYYCTGVSVNTAGYTLPVTETTSADGSNKEFTLTLFKATSVSAPWNLSISLTYQNVTKVDLGHPMPLPPGCKITPSTALKDLVSVELAGNPADTVDNSFLLVSGSLYPIRPVNQFSIICGTNTAYYIADWSTSDTPVKIVTAAPVNLLPGGDAFQQVVIDYSESYEYGAWTSVPTSAFQPPLPGRTLLRFSNDVRAQPTFVTVSAAAPVPGGAPCTIGIPIEPNRSYQNHDGKNGYIYNASSYYDASVYQRASRTGDIIAVNTNVSGLPAGEMTVAWYGASGPAPSIAWPLAELLVQYSCSFPTSAPVISVPGPGIGNLTALEKTGSVYSQPDLTLPGYNPNEEHAFMQGGVLYALRSDLNKSTTSLPYVLLKYQDTSGAVPHWRMSAFKVSAAPAASYPATAGLPLLPPTPLNLLPASGSSLHKAADTDGTPWYYQDHNGGHWTRASNGRNDAQQSGLVMQWYYPLQTGFYYPFSDKSGNKVKIGDPVPFQNGGLNHTDPPCDSTYLVAWPSQSPTLNIGETLTTSKNGLPAVSTMAAVQKIYDQGAAQTPSRPAALLFAPYTERRVPLDTVPEELKLEDRGGLKIFTDLPFVLRSRLLYYPETKELAFQGLSIDSVTGEPLLLTNIMSARERDTIKALSANTVWRAKIETLFTISLMPDLSSVGEPQALSAGFARASGYVVLAENDDPSLGSAPVALHVLQVQEGPYQGEIKVIKSDNPFDEKLTLRFSGDFAGNTDNIYFAWYYQPDNGSQPKLPLTASGSTSGWTLFNPGSGKGQNDITIQGAGKLTLEDNWFMVRYYYGDDPATPAFDPLYPSLVNGDPINPPGATDINLVDNFWGSWAGAPGGTTAQLAEGWIKRVIAGLNPLDARVSDFRNNPTDVAVSMITQAGERYSGAVALDGSADNINNLGLIAAYQTVLNRGEDFSINNSPPVNSSATNTALLDAATQIAGLYTMLGNEAFDDAQDPTVTFESSNGQTGSAASTLFAFQNQEESLLEEELALLRGRDSTGSTTQAPPVYNRLIWNFTGGDGEQAYVQTYNISDINIDGFINEADAKVMYPQGHGDAWGHYLTAMTTWYGLLRNPNYSWIPRSESVLVGDSPVPVNFLDERKFARVASYKAQTGAEIVDFTYRKLYVDDPSGQYLGYKDAVKVANPDGSNSNRAWGVDEWARRSGQGAYFDWVAGNAILPALDTLNSGIQKVDRTTVPELTQVAGSFLRIQFKVDQANAGYNPLGLAPGVVSFDIDPNLLVSVAGREPQSHFEQIYGRAVKAVQNAATAYDYASQYSRMLRNNELSLVKFRSDVIDQEWSYTNQLIEIFGFPYGGDIGPGKSYPAGYNGPDLFHYDYVDVPKLTGLDGAQYASDNVSYSATVDVSKEHSFNLSTESLDLSFPVSPGMPWKFSVPAGWGERHAPGELQMALQSMLNATAQYQKSMESYAVGLSEIKSAAELLEAVYDIKQEQIEMKETADNSVIGLHTGILAMEYTKQALEAKVAHISKIADEVISGLPTVVGTANDPSFWARGELKLALEVAVKPFEIAGTILDATGKAAELAASALESSTEMKVFVDDARVEVQTLVVELQRAADAIRPLILDMYAQSEAVQQAQSTYQAALAKGIRIIDERETFRKQTAGEIQGYRYQDLGFRSFRNDALQKYWSTFSLASRYSYLAATAYDYETNLLRSDKASGAGFLTGITRQLAPGAINDGVPLVGMVGLSDPLARLNQNFAVYKTQLGFNNPQSETTPFSLRNGHFRIKSDAASDGNWQDELRKWWVADLNTHPSFKRYCRPFTADTTIAQPGLVIPFTTQVRFGNNFFGWPLGSGDAAYDPSRFSTKIRSVGLWFKGYDAAGLASTPRAYLVPTGSDVLRSPTGDGFAERHWQVVDQKLPVPFPISAEEVADGNYIPMNTSLKEVMGGIRQFSSIRAYPDPGVTGNDAQRLAQMNTDSGLVGRSVWNSEWLLIIPGGYLLDNPATGLNNFIDKVSDIRLFFQTYSYSGN